MSKSTGKEILIIKKDGSRHIIQAPSDFDWQKFPENVFIGDGGSGDMLYIYTYIGTHDIPHYKWKE